MPYKSQKKRAEYMQKYRDFQKRQKTALTKAILSNNTELARQILSAKPSINIASKESSKRQKKK